MVSLPDHEGKLVELIASTFYDPYHYVMIAYPWGKKGTLLADETGPDDWQTEALKLIGSELLKIAETRAVGRDDVDNTVRIAVSSGHGVGKTALIAWIIDWWLSTRPYTQAVATAGTMTQLKTKLWREVKKWTDLAVNGHWFKWTATALALRSDPAKWMANAIPWSENNPQAFAGTHEKYVLYVYDEASTIADIIWEVSEGAFTTEGPHLWLAFGNPTQAIGRFREAWTRFKKRWITFEVDARRAKKANKKLLQQWIEDYGIDSDFVKVRVRGIPPASGPKQMIPMELVLKAIERTIEPGHVPWAIPKLMGVDPAGGGESQSVIVLRHGPLMLKDIKRYQEKDLLVFASHVANLINQWKPDVVFIDAIGLGKGVYDRLVQLGFSNVVACNSGDRSQTVDSLTFYNPRVEWWARMRAWLESADIPYDVVLRDELAAPQFNFDIQMHMRLESKDDMELRGIASPDTADALALTFAHPVPVKMGQMEDEGVETEPEVV